MQALGQNHSRQFKIIHAYFTLHKLSSHY